MVDNHDIYHLNPSLVPRSIFRDGLFLLILRLFGKNNILVFFHGWNAEFHSRILNSRALRLYIEFVFGYGSRFLVLASQFVDDLAAVGISRDRIFLSSTMYDGQMINVLAPAAKHRGTKVLFMSRFVAVKGVFELLEAFNVVCGEIDDIHLIVAGDGPDLARARDWCMRKQLQARITFPGFVSGESKVKLLQNSDIFALPSYHGEGCPIALLEAMAAGLALIVTPVGGIPDIVRNGENGFIVPPRDVPSVAEALRELAENADLRQKMGSRNASLAHEKYEAKAFTKRLEAHYSALVCRELIHDRSNREIS